MAVIPLAELSAMETAWRAERTRLYRAFMASLTPEQRALFDARDDAARWVRRCELWQRAIREGRTLQPTAIRPIWPGEVD